MTEQETTWLLQEFPKYQGTKIMKNTYRMYLEAERILNGWKETKPRDCVCTYGELEESVNKLYDQFQAQ